MAIPITTPAPGTIETRRDMLVTAGWSFQILDVTIRDVIKVGGISREIEKEEWVDAGANITHFFSKQIKTYISDGSITYRIDPTTNEFDYIHNLVTASLNFGIHYDFTLIKYNHGIEVFRINIYEALFTNESHPDYTKNESSAYDVELKYSAPFWEIVKV
jgi:hypothetical protein